MHLSCPSQVHEEQMQSGPPSLRSHVSCNQASSVGNCDLVEYLSLDTWTVLQSVRSDMVDFHILNPHSECSVSEGRCS